MSPLPNGERRALLAIARRAVEQAVRNRENPEFSSFGREPILATLQERAGVFVTLHRGKSLRGCMGRLRSAAPLGKTVADVAVSAALHDPRFRPIEFFELAELVIEISVLSAFERVRAEEIQVGRHGLVMERGPLRGLLLPQVAVQYGWSRERFLEETCEKAGLERHMWREPETRILAFTAEVFSEADSSVE